MDDLDRLFRRLVQNMRAEYPAYLTSPFPVAELYQSVVPYRRNRTALEIEMNQDYEHALTRLLSGERSYVIGDPAMQEARIPFVRKDLCHTLIRARLKDQSIEHAVQQIAEGPGKDETGADDKSAVIFLLDDGLDIIYPEDHGDQPKKRQGHLAPGTAELPAPGHAFVLYKIDLRFVAQ